MKLDIIYNEDCLEGMKKFKDKCIDVVITDPPYGINVIGGAKSFGSIGGANIVSANQYMSIINDDKKIDLSELFRISKHQIIFGGNYFQLPISKGWIVWDKKKRNNWWDNFSDGELIWTSFNQPLRIFRYLYMGLMQEGQKEKRVHPTQKPIALLEWILKYYTKEDDIILDPFMGSGTTAIACKRFNRHYIGFEISKEYYKIAKERLEQEKTLWDIAEQRLEAEKTLWD